ncbi:aspartyl-phosphate phosphatase Spo0E family protein [Clostridium sp.]|uniref:aspartyl-phosphate phosphatase Spo0E family protein n=1 Tax=Clostridium sp. TaxID=1506 RepID=UPI001A57ED51|nr:aspartyl-phosphate phosphatase Spo0E family protein [Clostridium sp.]MBK5241230.1 aspartyl-phosphate phosphatase Spo0E family protein [Clostridium sp.]
MNNVILETEVLREKLENLITLKGITHIEVLKLSRKLDKYILMYYSEKPYNEIYTNK